MKKQISFCLLSLIVVCLVGCDNKTESTNGTNSTVKAVSTDPKSLETNASDANNAAGTTTKAVEPSLDLAKIPAELKSDAYEYYGLGRTEPIKMTVNQNGSSEPASQTVKLTKVENGKAEFTISNEGGLSKLGEVLVSLDKEGVRVVSVNGQKADTNTFELPTGLSKGKTWPFKLPSGEQSLAGSNVVKGTESITTAVGTYNDALVVVSTAAGKQNGESVQVSMKNWLVKGRGLVKAVITNVSGKNKQTFTMEEWK
jgi:uncharacterized lipoprotein NlpE involved in copper resistance